MLTLASGSCQSNSHQKQGVKITNHSRCLDTLDSITNTWCSLREVALWVCMRAGSFLVQSPGMWCMHQRFRMDHFNRELLYCTPIITEPRKILHFFTTPCWVHCPMHVQSYQSRGGSVWRGAIIERQEDMWPCRTFQNQHLVFIWHNKEVRTC